MFDKYCSELSRFWISQAGSVKRQAPCCRWTGAMTLT